MLLKLSRTCLTAAAACLLLATTAGAAGLDEMFLAARDAARAGDAKRLEQIAPRFQDHLLEPYVQYWRLQANLKIREPEEIRAYLAANRDTPLADYLRRDWLKLLGKNEQWALFDVELRRKPLPVSSGLLRRRACQPVRCEHHCFTPAPRFQIYAGVAEISSRVAVDC